MKYQVKYSSTQKFILQFDGNTYGELKTAAFLYITSNYEQNLDTIQLSLNGKDPVEGNDEDSLSAVGIVPGDLLTVLRPSDSSNCIQVIPSNQRMTSADTSSKEKLTTKDSFGEYSKCSLIDAIDEKPPECLVNAFSQYRPIAAGEVINLLVHLTVIESGFHLNGNPSLPPDWRNMVTMLEYTEASCKDFNFIITLVTMGDVKQITASFCGQTSEIAVKIDIKDYVKFGEITLESVQKVSQFAMEIKNNLIYPVHVALHGIHGIPPPWHMCGLPQEVIVHICHFLNLKEIITLGKTAKRLNTAMNDNKIWSDIFIRDFPSASDKSDNHCATPWKNEYKSVYLKQKEERELDTGCYPDQPWLNNPHPLYHPLHPNNPNFQPIPSNPHPLYHPLHPNNPNFQPIPSNPYPFYNPPDRNPWGPHRDPDSPYFEDPSSGCPGYPGQPYRPPMMPYPKRPRGPRLDFI